MATYAGIRALRASVSDGPRSERPLAHYSAAVSDFRIFYALPARREFVLIIMSKTCRPAVCLRAWLSASRVKRPLCARADLTAPILGEAVYGPVVSKSGRQVDPARHA